MRDFSFGVMCFAGACCLFSGCERPKSDGDSSLRPQSEQDVTIFSAVVSGTEAKMISIKLKGERARMDCEGASVSTIHDPEEGVIMLDHSLKLFRKMPIELPDTGLMSDEVAKALADSCEMRFTGDTRKIGEWECEKFVIFDSFGRENVPPELMFRAVAWIAKDFEDGDEIQARKDKMAPAELLRWLAAVTSKKFGVPGFAVRTETKVGSAPTMISTCRKVSFDPLQESDFQIPEGYSEFSG